MNSLNEILSSVFIIIGVFFMLVASIGMIRLPDFYIRISAITKTSTIGLGFVLLGVSVYFNTLEVVLKALGVIFFIVLTSPASAHITAKAATFIKIPFWEKTDLKDYNEASKMPDDPKVEGRH